MSTLIKRKDDLVADFIYIAFVCVYLFIFSENLFFFFKTKLNTNK